MELDSKRSKHEAEIAVSDMLNHAYSWLSRAVASTDTDPMHVKEVRAYAYTISEATKQRDLSRSIKMDAEEMARRADYALGKAIRDGQENGTVATRRTGGWDASSRSSISEERDRATKVTDIAKPGELYGHDSHSGILALADNASPAEFEEALTEAKAEGNLSRANLVRKVKPERHDSEPDVIDVDYETVDVETGEVVEKTPKRLNRSMKICATTVGDLETVYRKHGAKALASTLTIMSSAWDSTVWDAFLIRGIALFCNRYATRISQPRLIKRLSEYPYGVKGIKADSARTKRSLGTNQDVATASIITNAYNKGLRGVNSLGDWFKDQQ